MIKNYFLLIVNVIFFYSCGQSNGTSSHQSESPENESARYEFISVSKKPGAALQKEDDITFDMIQKESVKRFVFFRDPKFDVVSSGSNKMVLKAVETGIADITIIAFKTDQSRVTYDLKYTIR